MNGEEELRTTATLVREIEASVSEIFIGSPHLVRLAVLGLVGSLHVLIEDIPGVGKTTLALSLAEAAGLGFSRIQFTPDLLPADVLGMNVWDPESRSFVFRPGPIEAQAVLADELNRTSPRTQSAFLEAMQEEQITIDGISRKLPEPFFLIATQNPGAFTGTFPLPEAELDRFGLSFQLGYPDAKDETEILKIKTHPNRRLRARTVASPADIAAARNSVLSVHVSEPLREYIVSVARATRDHPDIRLGASPRAAITLQQAARAAAAADGRDFAIPEDVENLAPAVLAHRIQLSPQARLARLDAPECVRRIAASIPKPTGL
ncbi:MAG TPA: MoxR family ATPase [Treponemataceae bacterium]|nr:MoxR family ATPase [Treponemataceae bacterium]